MGGKFLSCGKGKTVNFMAYITGLCDNFLKFVDFMLTMIKKETSKLVYFLVN